MPYYHESPEEFQKWKKEIELEFVDILSRRALVFQRYQAEVGRTVTITEATHQVIKEMSSPDDDHYWLKRCQNLHLPEK